MSESSDGRIRLDYSSGGRAITKLWEPAKQKVLEVTFNADGSIMAQRLIDHDSKLLREISDDFIRSLQLDEVAKADYKEVTFDRECPNCGKKELRRYVEEFRSSDMLPVLPLYTCKNCRAQSYYLTDEYLEYLVLNNKEMFTEQELKELSADKPAFVAELKGYIIRILSSKKITSIK
jgi:DNA-directed RNA polymerase subunit M/transcription elongation factor TFIIS